VAEIDQLFSLFQKDTDWSNFVNAKDDLLNTALVSAHMRRVQICCAWQVVVPEV
jgi:hypothetical protein